MLANEGFNNDRKDAGELGARHTVTALYELVPVGAEKPLIDPFKYQLPQATAGSVAAEIRTVKLRYKAPQGRAGQQFAAVAEFGLLLRQSEERGTATYATALHLAQAGRGPDADGYRAELVRLVQLVEGLTPVAKIVGVR